MFSGFNGGHLLEKVFPDKKSDAGKEGKDSDSDPIITSVVVSIVEALFSSVCFFNVALAAYASEHNYRKEQAYCSNDDVM